MDYRVARRSVGRSNEYEQNCRGLRETELLGMRVEGAMVKLKQIEGFQAFRRGANETYALLNS